MSGVRLGRTTMCVVALALPQCTKPRTELVVTVWSELAWGAGRDLQSLALTVRREGAEGPIRWQQTKPLSGDPGQWQLPLSFGLYPADTNDTTPVWIEVLGCAARNECIAGEALVVQRAVVSYRREETVGFDMWLAARCRGVMCAADATCARETGQCVTARGRDVDVHPLPGGVLPAAMDVGVSFDDAMPDVADADLVVEVDASVPLLDGATDAVDSAAMDAPSSDGAIDAGRDVPTEETMPVDAALDTTPDLPRDAAPLSTQRSCAGTDVPGCGLVEIAGGTFTMGAETCSSPASATCATGAAPPQMNITVGDFALDAYEVTVARFRTFWNARDAALATVRSRPIAYPNGASIAWTAAGREPLPTEFDAACNWTRTENLREMHPINCVDWWTAQEFCVWDRARLPTAAEWEYGARFRPVSGLLAGRTYPWGNAPPSAVCDRAQYGSCRGDEGGTTRHVGSFPSGASGGLFDLAGNVREWTADKYAEYDSGYCWGAVSQRNPLCVRSDITLCETRGGSGGWDALLLRSASRLPQPCDSVYPFDLGFRCARSR